MSPASRWELTDAQPSHGQRDENQTLGDQLIYESKTWDRRYREIWFHPNRPAIRLEAGKGKSEELAELLRKAVHVLEEMQPDIARMRVWTKANLRLWESEQQPVKQVQHSLAPACRGSIR